MSTQKKNTIRVSQMPDTITSSEMDFVKKLDKDGDGAIDGKEFAKAAKSMKSDRASNQQLTKALIVLSVFTLLLIGAMFGVSIAAARLAKDTTTGANGVLESKTDGSLLKTGEALFEDRTYIADMTSLQLKAVKKLVLPLTNGDVEFDVKGFAKSGDKVLMIVEGGTITFDQEGISDSTGSAQLALDFAEVPTDVDGRRRMEETYAYTLVTEYVKCQSCPIIPDDGVCLDGRIATECYEETHCCPFHGWGTKSTSRYQIITTDEPPETPEPLPPPLVIEDVVEEEPVVVSSASTMGPLASMIMALAATGLFL